jgi:arginase family enzyme
MRGCVTLRAMHPARPILDELRLLLRPAGGGVHLVSTGRAEQLALQRRLYGVDDVADVDAAHLADLAAIVDARVVILGVPSDVGAGFRRGANLGPQAVRSALLAGDPEWRTRQRARGVIDIGDVFVVPQLLSDDLLAPAAREAVQRALYPHEAARADLPVAPLSIAERALDLVFSLNPTVKLFVIGGDHSTAWPAVAALVRARTRRLGAPALAIVQPDAHTDLLPERLGIPICFATWSYHANELIGRNQRLVQVGTRASRFPREHWESTLDVRQFWAAECRRDPQAALTALVDHVAGLGLPVYFSNDIDGTDDEFADATGTPEPAGLDPEFLVELIRRLGERVGLVGGDIMEVAPPLGPDNGARTVALAARYTRETLDQLVRAATTL